jgi:hypothetical protein
VYSASLDDRNCGGNIARSRQTILILYDSIINYTSFLSSPFSKFIVFIVLEYGSEFLLLLFNYCTRRTGVFILLIIFLASLNRDLSQESRCEVVMTTKS